MATPFGGLGIVSGMALLQDLAGFAVDDAALYTARMDIQTDLVRL